MNEQNPIILFDGYCNLCNSWIDFIIKRDKSKIFKFAAISSESGKEILKNYTVETEGIDSIILIENEKCYTKSSATLEITKRLSGIWPALYVLMILPKYFRDFIYDFIAKNRYRIFGRKESCRLPSPAEKERFI